MREENRYIVYSNSCRRKKEEGRCMHGLEIYIYIYPSVGFCLHALTFVS